MNVWVITVDPSIQTHLTARQRARIQYHISRLGSAVITDAVRAERNLIRWYAAEAVPQLIEATRSRSAQVRLRAGWALGCIGDGRAFDTLARLIEDQDEDVRYDALI